MLSTLFAEISQFRAGRTTIDEFESWFERNHYGMFAEPQPLLQLSLDVEHALSSFRFEHLSEDTLKQDLDAAARAFASDETLSRS